MDDRDKEIARLRGQLDKLAGESAQPHKSPKGGGCLIAFIAVLILGATAVALAQREGDAYNSTSPSDRIQKSCEREYGRSGEEAVNACRIRLSIETLQEGDKRQLDRARRGAR